MNPGEAKNSFMLNLYEVEASKQRLLMEKKRILEKLRIYSKTADRKK
jgi:hypothetical protein